MPPFPPRSPPGDIWQRLETFFTVTTWVWGELCYWHLGGMQLNIPVHRTDLTAEQTTEFRMHKKQGPNV